VGFDYWEVVPRPGALLGTKHESGYVNDLIADKFPAFLEPRDKSRQFFVMCHRKEPNKEFTPHPWHVHLYRDDVKIPDTSEDDYNSSAGAAANATLRIVENIRYYRKRAPRWPVNCPRCHRKSTFGLSPPRKRVRSSKFRSKSWLPFGDGVYP
jgi:hypothetical protein